MVDWKKGLALVLLTVAYTECWCPSSFENFNHACYYFGQTPVASSTDAFYACVNLGGYLININAEMENNFTMSRLSDQRTPDGYWTGGIYNPTTGKWVWQKTNSKNQYDYTNMNFDLARENWGPHQPDEYSDWQVPQHNIAIMLRYRPLPYRWYSENSNLVTPNGMSYICEADWKE